MHFFKVTKKKNSNKQTLTMQKKCLYEKYFFQWYLLNILQIKNKNTEKYYKILDLSLRLGKEGMNSNQTVKPTDKGEIFSFNL